MSDTFTSVLFKWTRSVYLIHPYHCIPSTSTVAFFDISSTRCATIHFEPNCFLSAIILSRGCPRGLFSSPSNNRAKNEANFLLLTLQNCIPECSTYCTLAFYQSVMRRIPFKYIVQPTQSHCLTTAVYRFATSL